MSKYLSSQNALNMIGSRLKAYRIDYPLSQKELADKSGVAVRSISRMENGEDVQFGNLVKILIALELDGNLDLIVPDPQKKPSYYLSDRGSTSKRERVSRKTTKKSGSGIRWGDEE